VRDFQQQQVPDFIIEKAIEAAITAPAPHHSTPWRFLVLNSDEERQHSRRIALLDVMAQTWQRDLQAEGKSEDEIAKRIARGNILRTAPCVVVAFMDLAAGAHTYPEVGGRNNNERDMFLVAGGAAVENFLITLSAQGYGSAWISSTLFCPETVRTQLALPESFISLGAIAIGVPATTPGQRPNRSSKDFRIN